MQVDVVIVRDGVGVGVFIGECAMLPYPLAAVQVKSDVDIDYQSQRKCDEQRRNGKKRNEVNRLSECGKRNRREQNFGERIIALSIFAEVFFRLLMVETLLFSQAVAKSHPLLCL